MDYFEFDSVFRVWTNGDITLVPGTYAPDVHHDDTYDILIDGIPVDDSETWEALSGYTGQYGYTGPVMHASEQFGGKLREDVLSHPGIYVLVVVEVFPDDDPEPAPAGWAVLRKKD